MRQATNNMTDFITSNENYFKRFNFILMRGQNSENKNRFAEDLLSLYEKKLLLCFSDNPNTNKKHLSLDIKNKMVDETLLKIESKEIEILYINNFLDIDDNLYFKRLYKACKKHQVKILCSSIAPLDGVDVSAADLIISMLYLGQNKPSIISAFDNSSSTMKENLRTDFFKYYQNQPLADLVSAYQREQSSQKEKEET